MTKRKRTNHAPHVKASAALEALREEKTLAELGEKYSVHPNQIQRWKKELRDHAIDIFGGHDRQTKDQEKTIQQLHEKVGQLIPMHRESVIFYPKRSANECGGAQRNDPQ